MCVLALVAALVAAVSVTATDIQIENRSGSALLEMTVTSSAAGLVFPALEWPRVEADSISTKQRFLGRKTWWNAFAFIFHTADDRTCYPLHAFDPSELHSLDDADDLVTISIEEPSARAVASVGDLAFSIRTSHVSTGVVRCDPHVPLHVQVLNRSGGPLLDVGVWHENGVWPFRLSPAVSWPRIEARERSPRQLSRYKLPGRKQFGLRFTTAEGVVFEIDNSWAGRKGREVHALEVEDALLFIKINQPRRGWYTYSMFTDHRSFGWMACKG